MKRSRDSSACPDLFLSMGRKSISRSWDRWRQRARWELGAKCPQECAGSGVTLLRAEVLLCLEAVIWRKGCFPGTFPSF